MLFATEAEGAENTSEKSGESWGSHRQVKGADCCNQFPLSLSLSL